MNTFYKFLIIIIVIFSGCTGRGSLKAGTSAPPLSFFDGTNQKRELSEFKGKVVLLNFWASWCSTCTSEIKALNFLYQTFRNDGFIIVGVGVDDEFPALKAVMDSQGASYPIFIDSNNEARAHYRLSGVPESILIDRQGKIAMVVDPDSGELTTRMLGPREWDSPKFRAEIRSLLAKNKK